MRFRSHFDRDFDSDLTMFPSSASSHSTSTFCHTSPLSSRTTYGTLSHSGLEIESSMIGSGFSPLESPSLTLATRLTFSLEHSHIGDQERGSRIAVYKRTSEVASSAEKLVSISAMPAYKAKSHEVLRWEDYKFTGKVGFGFSSSAVPSTSSATTFSIASWGTTSISFAPVKPNSFGKTLPSVATQTSFWKYPLQGHTSTSFASQPFQFSTSANSFWTTNPTPSFDLSQPFISPPPSSSFMSFNPSAPSSSLNPLNPSAPSSSFNAFNSFNSFKPSAPSSSFNPSAPSSSFNPSAPSNSYNSFHSVHPSAPSSSFNPFNSFNSFSSFNPSAPVCSFNPSAPSCSFNPSAPSSSSNSFNPSAPSSSSNPFNSFNPSAPSSSSNPFRSFNPSAPSSSFNSFIPTTNLTSPVSASPFNLFNSSVLGTTFTSAVSSTSSVSLGILNNYPFTNSSNSLSTHTSSSCPAFAKVTGGVDSRPSSLNAFWSAPTSGPFIYTATAAANSIVPPVSSGLNSTFNQPTTLFNPCVTSTQNCNATTGINGQNVVSEVSSSQIVSTGEQLSAASPLGTFPPNHMFFDGSQSNQSIQYGISSIPVKDKPAPVKHSLLTTRHLSGRIKLPVRKYDPKLNARKKPYFSDTKEILVAAYVPRENPRAFVEWPPRAMVVSGGTQENERDDPTKDKQLSTPILDLPSRLQQPDYYTQPPISELEAKERADPGSCMCVKDFVVGRHGYGSIKFLGETDVRKVDIESNVQFNYREVIVYMDDSKKPPVGEGLNKLAEITLLNIKCIDKKTGMEYTDKSKIEKYTKMLMKKASAQGAEFISYDPVEGEWKFRVQHF